MKRIVVGIDGSAESKQALRWAVAEAKLRGAALRVVHTWFFPYIAPGPGVDPVLLDADLIETVRRLAEELVDGELAELGDTTSGVDIERAVVEGAPAPARARGGRGSGPSCRWRARTRRLHRLVARLGQPAMCPPCALSARNRAAERALISEGRGYCGLGCEETLTGLETHATRVTSGGLPVLQAGGGARVDRGRRSRAARCGGATIRYGPAVRSERDRRSGVVLCRSQAATRPS